MFRIFFLRFCTNHKWIHRFMQTQDKSDKSNIKKIAHWNFNLDAVILTLGLCTCYYVVNIKNDIDYLLNWIYIWLFNRVVDGEKISSIFYLVQRKNSNLINSDSKYYP